MCVKVRFVISTCAESEESSTYKNEYTQNGFTMNNDKETYLEFRYLFGHPLMMSPYLRLVLSPNPVDPLGWSEGKIHFLTSEEKGQLCFGG